VEVRLLRLGSTWAISARREEVSQWHLRVRRIVVLHLVVDLSLFFCLLFLLQLPLNGILFYFFFLFVVVLDNNGLGPFRPRSLWGVFAGETFRLAFGTSRSLTGTLQIMSATVTK
jgi:hypothetical protein